MAKVIPLNLDKEARSGDAIQRAIETQLRERVETWTRFDSRDLSIGEISVGTLDVLSVGEFRISLEPAFSRGMGRGSIGDRHRSDTELHHHAFADIAQLREVLPAVLKTWDERTQSELNPDLPLALPTAGGKPAFHNIECETCRTTGKLSCSCCGGLGRMNCHHCIRGRKTCVQCNGAGTRNITCAACYGTGRRYESVMYQSWDHVRGQYVTETRTENVTCSSCAGNPQRMEMCVTCSHAGNVLCSDCSGTSQLPCSRCASSGKVACDSCAGLGFSHEQYIPIAIINKEWRQESVDPDEDSEAALALVAHDLSQFAARWAPGTARFDCSGIQVSREIEVPFAKANIGLNDDFRITWAVGPQYRLEQLDGLGDLLLDDDAEAFEGATRRTDGKGVQGVLKMVFASEVNGYAAALLKDPLSKGSPGADAVNTLVARTNGFLSPSHINRTVTATSTLVKSRLKHAHAKGLLAAFGAALLAVAVAVMTPRWLDVPLSWLLPMIAVLGVLGATEIFLRFRSDLSIPYVKGQRLISLRHVYRYERAWFASYLLLAVAASVFCVYMGQAIAGTSADDDISQPEPVAEHESVASSTQILEPDLAPALTAKFPNAPTCQPSFECGGSLTRVETLVCRERKLCELDNALAEAYRQQRAASGTAARRQLQIKQRTWLKEHRNSCQDRNCIELSYQQRIAELER